MKVLCSSQMGTGTVLGQTMRVMAVAGELRRRGHEVKFLAGGRLLPVLRKHHFDCIELPPLPELNISAGLMSGADEKRREETVAAIREIVRRVAEAEIKTADREKADVLLCGNLSGPVSAQTLGIPAALVFLQPHGSKTLELFTRRLSAHSEGGQYILRALEAAGLLLMEGMPELGGDALIPAFVAEGAALEKKVHFTGPLPLEKPENLPGRDELKKRYTGRADKPLVYVTIGGGSPLIGEEFLRLVLDMFREQPGMSGVVSTGLAVNPDRLAGCNPPENVSLHQFVPGMELIKAGDVVIFHGGSSTLMNCIACGRPAVVVPSMAEQEDNGMVLERHGAGIMLDKKSLTPARLAEAVKKILDHDSYRSGALKLQELGRRYGGAEKAADLVEKLVSGRAREE